MFLAVILCGMLVVPAFAATNEPSKREPRTPEGFTHRYTVERDMDADAELIDGVLNIFSNIPGFGGVVTVINAINFIDAYNRNPRISAQYTDFVYEAEDAVGDYGVPYVYWHKLKLTYTADSGAPEVRWSDYYEFAVAPR